MKKLITLLIFSLSSSAFALDNNTKVLLGSLAIYYLHKDINNQPRSINYHPAKLQQEIVTIISPGFPDANPPRIEKCKIQVYDPQANFYKDEIVNCVRQ